MAANNNNVVTGFTDPNANMQLTQSVSNNSSEVIKPAQPINDNTAPSNIIQTVPSQQPIQSQIPQSSNTNNNAPPKILRQGWMMKKGGLVQNWKKRLIFFFLRKSAIQENTCVKKKTKKTKDILNYTVTSNYFTMKLTKQHQQRE